MSRLSVLLCTFSTIFTIGCGDGIVEPELGTVSGTVTLDGTPVKNARIIFRPVESGRPSRAETDDAGAYEMKFKREMKGATVGKNEVIVSTRIEGGGSPGDPDYVAPEPETIPEKYNKGVHSELIVDVKPGENAIDIKLTN